MKPHIRIVSNGDYDTVIYDCDGNEIKNVAKVDLIITPEGVSATLYFLMAAVETKADLAQVIRIEREAEKND